MLETKRLILRHWQENDAENLFKYASDPDVGFIAGWPPHKNIDESLDIIKNVFWHPEQKTYAVCLKSDNKVIGSISLKFAGQTDMTEKKDECELGYWLAKIFWGQNLMPEAVKEMLRHAFEDLNINKVWCGYYDGNIRSKRVQEKCGFKYQWTTHDLNILLLNEKRTGHVNAITKKEWLDLK